ncbi:TRAP transporter permease [Phaeobacter gallaeciensis]|uniref:TRAP transporter permease n=1 Tax=Phaeobacter gallaeciensis TaxID=60890 RepID=UPI000BBBE0FA|nr:TRAP transporter fused permease subunit [Phaeobacter gallaeciensis]ATF20623.1 TRAP transporter, 4TM/12TM fusion protein [Phaeobacter gallaeciensis]ATF24732.1 TRAP transporter, 4TM/12TM fusion protein [Phaeobacter gallaeciensis]
MTETSETAALAWGNQILRGLIVALSVSYAANLHRYAGLSVYDAQLLVAVFALGLASGFLSMAQTASTNAIRLGCASIAAACLATGGFVAVYFVQLSMDAPFVPPRLVVIGCVLLGALLVLLRRAAGTGILIVVLIFLAYGLWGHLLPGDLQSRPTYWDELVIYLSLDANGILGSALKVAVVIVVPYLLFGQFLTACGAADFFNDLALSGMGRFRGGPAKVAVSASALFGSISGSAVGNVVGTGVVTIPMMKKSGFQSKYAAAVEAVASTGGQLVPPVMGAAAFIMADFIGVDYSAVMLAALPSALLYYCAIFINVDLTAAKRGVAKVDEAEIPSGREALRQGWHFILPFAVLIYTLFALNMRPERSAVISTLVLLAGSFVFGYKGRRIRPSQILESVAAAGKAAIGLILVCAAAGLIIGILNITGLAFNLTLHIITASGGSLLALALITAVISIVLGMGMPTVGVYILLATLVAPALIEYGVPVISAHLFVFYFGLMSMITPPVALASFAAANIAGASAWATSKEAMKLAWPAYLVPFLFLFAPGLILEGDLLSALWAIATALVGIFMVTASFVGYFFGKRSGMFRVILGIGGALCLIPSGLHPAAVWSDAVGLCVLALLVVSAKQSPHGAAQKTE